MNIINELIAIKNGRCEIDFSHVRFNESQQYLMGFKTKERITVFNNFNGRQMGQTWGCIFKAFQLSNEKNKDIILVSGRNFSIQCIISSFQEVLNILKIDHLISKIERTREYMKIVFKNNSIIKVRTANETSIIGQRCDYLIADNIKLSDQSLLNTLIFSIASKEEGRLYIFPSIL